MLTPDGLNSQNNFCYTLKVVYEKEYEVGHWHQLCLLLFFCFVFFVNTLKECKTFDFSVFVGISFAIAFKRRTMGRIG